MKIDRFYRSFFYHHRELISAAVLKCASQTESHLSKLAEYVESTYGPKFDEMDKLLSTGRIRTKDIRMLFCPNDIIVSQIHQPYTAYALSGWPTGSPDLTCWSWIYDGLTFRRKSTTLSISSGQGLRAKSTVKLRDLMACPIKYVPPELVEYLKNRGKTYWSLRNGKFVAYQGWDYKTEVLYV